MFRLLVQAHAYLKPDSGPRCVVVLCRAGQNNACVHWTSPQSLICSVIRGETQPTRLRLSSCSPPPFPFPHPCFLPAAKGSEGARSDLVQQQRLWLLVAPRLKFPSANRRVCGGGECAEADSGAKIRQRANASPGGAL